MDKASELVRNCPRDVLILHGREDPVTPTSAMMAFVADFPSISARSFDGSGYPVLLNQPDAVIAAIG